MILRRQTGMNQNVKEWLNKLSMKSTVLQWKFMGKSCSMLHDDVATMAWHDDVAPSRKPVVEPDSAT